MPTGLIKLAFRRGPSIENELPLPAKVETRAVAGSIVRIRLLPASATYITPSTPVTPHRSGFPNSAFVPTPSK